ncbi:MAG: hypothetical protein ABIR54_12025 [Burkholderiaceae bacterium]
MNFKLSCIAAALCVVGSAAMATPLSPNAPLSDYTTGTTDIYIAGSSAVDLALTKFIANTCAPNTLDTYRTDAGGKTYYLWTCAAGASSSWGTANSKIAIHKNTNSSSDGVLAVSNNTSLAFLQVSDLTGASSCAISPTVVAATGTIPSYNLYLCGTSAGNAGVGTLQHAPRFGFADSEPKQFGTVSNLTTVYPLSIVFGIPVSKNVRDTLQASQNLPVGGESEADMPSLTTTQINSIFTGNFSSWSDLGITVSASDNAIYRVRRSNGSGTTRAFDVTFIGDFCTPGANAISPATALVTATIPQQCNSVGNGGNLTLQAGTSDDMAACVAGFQTSGGVGAIGYLSTDYLPGTSDNYRWVKVDGYAPKLLNVANGSWKDWSEESLNYNKVPALSGDDSKFFLAIKATSASAALMSEIAQNQPQTTSGLWTGGVMGALPTNHSGAGWGVAPSAAALLAGRTDASVLANPANMATRNGTSGYNLCNVPTPVSGFQAQ